MPWQRMNLNYLKGLNNPIVIIELFVDIMFIIDIAINFRSVSGEWNFRRILDNQQMSSPHPSLQNKCHSS